MTPQKCRSTSSEVRPTILVSLRPHPVALIKPLALSLILLGCSTGDLSLSALQPPPEAVNGDAGVPDNDAGLSDGGLMPSCPDGHSPCAETCCSAEEICQDGTCQPLGPACDELWPCPSGFGCDPELGRCIPGARRCEYRPPTGAFSPTLLWEWTGSDLYPEYNQVMMTPMVANLTDDNGDGVIDRHDIPDIVFTTFAGNGYRKAGVLRAISGDDGREHFAVADYAIAPGQQIALGDIDGDGSVDIVACLIPSGVIALERDGSYKWHVDDITCLAPAIADLDGDGIPEVITCQAALNGHDGSIRWKTEESCAAYVVVADLDGDGKPEVMTGRDVLSWDGQRKWGEEDPIFRRGTQYIAVADLNGDGNAEVVIVNTASNSDGMPALHYVRAFHHDGTPYWGPVDINQGQANLNDKCGGCGGGPPTIADFDGDGRPEIAIAGGYGYVIFEHDGTPKWFQPTKDLSSRVTGSSVFDFEGDGRAEAVYNDEHLLRIYDGETGDVLFKACNTTGTLQEYPVIVDVNNDGHANIVVAGNNYAFKTCTADDGTVTPSTTGIKVFGDASNNWVRTRRIWNQHTYHVTNIDEDGRIPAVPELNWRNPNLNNFRQNVQPGGLFDAPDLTGAPGPATCGNETILTVTVLNQGAAKTMPGVNVSLFARLAGQEPVLVQTLRTQGTLYPNQTEELTFLSATPTAHLGHEVVFTVRVDDDGQGNGRENECDEDNNTITFPPLPCSAVL